MMDVQRSDSYRIAKWRTLDAAIRYYGSKYASLCSHDHNAGSFWKTESTEMVSVTSCKATSGVGAHYLKQDAGVSQPLIESDLLCIIIPQAQFAIPASYFHPGCTVDSGRRGGGAKI